METRYQVFLSSTYTDLIEERQVAIKAVLELDHMPAGMELFPAIDDEAWLLIQDVIDASDYYVLIVGGRYGSTGSDGLGFTEKEYHYAVSQKKPVIALLHGGPGTIPRNKTETDPAAWEKLQKFRAHVESKHTCVYWTNRDELKSCLIVSLTKTVKWKAAVGWVRADQVPSEGTLADMLALQRRVSELEAQLASARTTAPAGAESLKQGDDELEVRAAFVTTLPGVYFGAETTHTNRVSVTWNAIFGAVAPTMIVEASEADLKGALMKFFRMKVEQKCARTGKFSGLAISKMTFSSALLDTCVIQFRALGLIAASDRKRALKDVGTYWALTPYGDQVMVQLRALRREAVPDDEEESAPEEAEQASEG